MTEERLDWIEKWATGWRKVLDEPQDDIYQNMPLSVAVDMILELVSAMKDSE